MAKEVGEREDRKVVLQCKENSWGEGKQGKKLKGGGSFVD